MPAISASKPMSEQHDHDRVRNTRHHWQDRHRRRLAHPALDRLPSGRARCPQPAPRHGRSTHPDRPHPPALRRARGSALPRATEPGACATGHPRRVSLRGPRPKLRIRRAVDGVVVTTRRTLPACNAAPSASSRPKATTPSPTSDSLAHFVRRVFEDCHMNDNAKPCAGRSTAQQGGHGFAVRASGKESKCLWNRRPCARRGFGARTEWRRSPGGMSGVWTSDSGCNRPSASGPAPGGLHGQCRNGLLAWRRVLSPGLLTQSKLGRLFHSNAVD